MYNAEMYVDDLLPCLIGQTLKEIEIILVNDGSTDNTIEKLRHYAGNDSSIRIVDKPNGGLSDARNAGINVAKGEYIWFVDADDFVFPEAAETMYRAVDERDYLISGFTRAVNRDKALMAKQIKEISERTVADNLEEMKRIRPFATWIGTVWRCLYKREVILCNDLRFRFSRLSHEDTLFNYEFLTCCSSCARINYQGYVYVDTPNSLGCQHKRNVNSAWLDITKDMINKIIDRFDIKENLDYYRNLHILYTVDCVAFVTTGYHCDSYFPYMQRMERWKYLHTNSFWTMANRFGFLTKFQKIVWHISNSRIYYFVDPLLLLLTRLHDKIRNS